jgi:flavin reductase (DIM6/NTAB) family NADH-FMN oxidoreductase RutF
MKIRLGPSDILFPVPAILIVSGTGDNINILTVSWIGIVSSDPPTLGISIHDKRHSLKLIKEIGEFSVNFPNVDLFEEVDYCGMVTGKLRNKFSDIGFTPQRSSKIKPPFIKECPYNIECVLSKEIKFGKWNLLLGEIVETHVDRDKIDKSNRAKISIKKINPLVYCATVREYWSLGKKLGNGFEVGKKIIQKLK